MLSMCSQGTPYLIKLFSCFIPTFYFFFHFYSPQVYTVVFVRRDLFTLVAASFSLLMVMMVCPETTHFYMCITPCTIFIFISHLQKVGLFLLQRVESAYVSSYGVTSVVHGDSDSLFSNLVTSVAADVKSENVTSVEMSSIEAGAAGAFQTFEDIQGMYGI